MTLQDPGRPLGLGLSSLGTPLTPPDLHSIIITDAQGGSCQQSSCCPWGTCHGTAWGPRLANLSKRPQREAGLWPATMSAE